MNVFWSSVASALVLLVPAVVGVTVVGPASPYFLASGGRFVKECPTSDCYVEYDWPCVIVSVIAEIGGSSVSLDMYGGGNWFQVEVSQWNDTAQSWTILSSSVLQTGAYARRQYTAVPAGTFNDGSYKIEVIKRTEAAGYLIPLPRLGFIYPVKFYGFMFSADVRAQQPPTLSRKIEMFSDSDSNGFGIEGPPASNCIGAIYQYQACNKGYPKLLANGLNAELHVEGWSGKGVVRGAYDMLPGSDTRAMPFFWNNTLGSNKDGSPWSFASWIPDVAIVSLGSNDYDQAFDSYIPDNATFIAAYVNMLKNIRASYPDQNRTKIVAITGGFPDEIYLPMSANGASAVAQYNAEAGDNVTVINIPEKDLNKYPDNYGCIDHRNVQGQFNVANFLIPKFKELLGWQ